MLKIFSDRHHQGLTESLILLFQKRLKGEIWFQKGLDWWKEGFWALQPFESTAIQYLERELEGLPGITLEEFKNTKFGILLCSIPQHVDMWVKLRDLYQPQAKLIFQVGNMWAFDNSFPIKNILASAVVPDIPGFNICTYHQEFSTDLYNYEPPKRTKQIYSFINCINVLDLYKNDWGLFLELERLLPEFEFESYGGQTRGGAIAPQEEVAKLTKEADLIFHVKQNGDGYSYGMHTASSCGKIIITRLSDYKGKLAEPLITPETCLIIDGKTPQQIADEIKILWDNKLEIMSENMSNKFKEIVSFDQEEASIREFLTRLL